MSAAKTLPLRDVHDIPAPPWWPPAPGWWLLLLAIALIVGGYLAWRTYRRRRRQRIAHLFDSAVAAADTPSAKIAAMSELLRRASRRIDPDADKLQGDDWLAFLDRGAEQPVFAAGAGALLREGGFRREVSQTEYEALHAVARQRFVHWMDGAR